MTQQPNDDDLLPLIDYRIWDGTSEGAFDVIIWIDPSVDAVYQKELPPLDSTIIVATAEGNARARKGDYIVHTEEGYRPMKPVIFRQTYPEAK